MSKEKIVTPSQSNVKLLSDFAHKHPVIAVTGGLAVCGLFAYGVSKRYDILGMLSPSSRTSAPMEDNEIGKKAKVRNTAKGDAEAALKHNNIGEEAEVINEAINALGAPAGR